MSAVKQTTLLGVEPEKAIGRISAQRQRDALLLALLRGGASVDQTPVMVIQNIEAMLVKPGPEPSPDEERWVDVFARSLTAILARGGDA